MTLTIHSRSFESGGTIPVVHTREGRDVSPELRWSGVPDRAESLALVVEDPDAPDPRAPERIFTHWVLYDLPSSTSGLSEGAERNGESAGGRSGRNDWGHDRYEGPMPPVGRHRYFFKLYALDTRLGDRGAPSREELEREMRGHVLAQAELVGTYEKQA